MNFVDSDRVRFLFPFFLFPVYCCRNWNDPNDPLSLNIISKDKQYQRGNSTRKSLQQIHKKCIRRWLYDQCFTLIGYGYMFFLTCAFYKNYSNGN